MRNSFNVWQGFQVKQGAKARSKSGGAKRRDWSRRKSFVSVCFVKTRDDASPIIGPLPQRRAALAD